jgi:hypothetical protein
MISAVAFFIYLAVADLIHSRASIRLLSIAESFLLPIVIIRCTSEDDDSLVRQRYPLQERFLCVSLHKLEDWTVKFVDKVGSLEVFQDVWHATDHQ